jgi:SAM-dependent methyltransferase
MTDPSLEGRTSLATYPFARSGNVGRVDVEQLKQQQRTVWGKGDYELVSEWLRPASVALCDACAVSAGQEVLDAGAGDGNFAIECAREGAAVVAADIAPVMVERGRARAQAEGFDIEWVEADVEDLPFEDARFDCVGSSFGAFIAPRPEVAAAELFRVVRPGGTVGMTAWVPGAFVTRMGEISREYAPEPPDPDEHRPESWGVEETARARFGGLAGSFEAEVRTVATVAESADAFADAFLQTGPPQVAAREAMPPDVYERFAADIRALVHELVEDDGGVARLVSEYLLIVARKPG